MTSFAVHIVSVSDFNLKVALNRTRVDNEYIYWRYFMSITELTARVQSAGKNRDHAQRVQLLKKAHVLDSKGDFDQRFFQHEKKSSNTIK